MGLDAMILVFRTLSFKPTFSLSSFTFIRSDQSLNRIRLFATPGGRSGDLVFPSLEIFPQFVVIHTVKVFSVVNEAEVDVFLEFSFFFYDPMDVGNLISGSSAFSKSSLIFWKFLVHILLKPSLENFEHYFASM